MPRNVANEQAIHWLHSMKNSDEGFDSINAENALNLIFEQQKKLRLMGATLSRIKAERDNYRKTLTALYEAGKEDITKVKDIPKEAYCFHCDALVRPETVRTERITDGYSSARYLVSVCPICGSDLEWRFLKTEDTE